MLAKVQAFTGAEQPPDVFCKKVFLERCLQNSLHSKACKETWHKCFPVNLAKFLKMPFLQNTSGQLPLLLAFQKQPSVLFYEKRCSSKFHKIHRKTPFVCKIFKNTFFTEHLWMTTSAFFVQCN